MRISESTPVAEAHENKGYKSLFNLVTSDYTGKIFAHIIGLLQFDNFIPNFMLK